MKIAWCFCILCLMLVLVTAAAQWAGFCACYAYCSWMLYLYNVLLGTRTVVPLATTMCPYRNACCLLVCGVSLLFALRPQCDLAGLFVVGRWVSV